MNLPDDIFSEAELKEVDNLIKEYEQDENAFNSAKQDMENENIDPLF